MKKLSNDDFFIKWKPIHKKGMLSYEIRNTVPLTIFIIIINIIPILQYPNKTEAIKTSVGFSMLFILICTASNILKWFNFEKRYKFITRVYEDNSSIHKDKRE